MFVEYRNIYKVSISLYTQKVYTFNVLPGLLFAISFPTYLVASCDAAFMFTTPLGVYPKGTRTPSGPQIVE